MSYDFEINIVHYVKLYEKKELLNQELEGRNINFNFIENMIEKN